MKKKITAIILSLFGLSVLTQAFINCGQLTGAGFVLVADPGFSSADSSGIPTSHPIELAQAPVNRNYLVPRSYVMDLLTSIFTSSAHPVTSLTGQLRQWVLNKPGTFGGNCDLVSSETGNDCGGDISNTSVSPLATASTMRAVSLTAACENILSDDQAVAAVLEKIQNPLVVPDQAALGQLYSLFRRGWDPDPSYVAVLIQMDHDIAQAGAANIDRWRMAIQTVCEDPFWQAL